MKNKSHMLLALLFAAQATSALAEEVVEPFIDGAILELGADIQQVEVRAKSLGPGFCAAEFNVNQDTVRITAPPLTWSDWSKAERIYLSPSTVKLGVRVICDTGVLAEVKYSR